MATRDKNWSFKPSQLSELLPSQAVENYFSSSTPMLLSSILGLNSILGNQDPGNRIGIYVSVTLRGNKETLLRDMTGVMKTLSLA